MRTDKNKKKKTWKIGDRILMIDDKKIGVVTGISVGWQPQIYRVNLDNGMRLWVNNIDNPNSEAKGKGFRKAKLVEFNPSKRCSR